MKNKKKIFVITILSLILVGMIIFSTFNVEKSNTILSIRNIQSDISSKELAMPLESLKRNNTEPEYAEGEAIIMTRPTVSLLSTEANKSSILEELTVEDTLEFKDKSKVRLYSSNSTNNSDDFTVSLVSSDKYTTEELITKLKDEGIHAEPNYILHTTEISNDTYLSRQWAIENNGQNGGIEGADINPISTSSAEEKVIAVIDTGVDYIHSDLENVMWENPYKDSTDLPGQYGYDFGDDDANPMDSNGHGTHVAGIIAAQSNNGQGITGSVLANSNIKIMALKIMNSEGKQYTSNAIKAYNYIYKAQSKGINVVAINDSWGSYIDNLDEESVLKEVIDKVGQRGALSICSEGNDSIDTDEKIHSPSGLNSDYIISVAATNISDELSDFSNYGTTTADIAAPGSNILSTVPYNVFNPSIYTVDERSVLCSKYEKFDTIDYNNILRTGGNVQQSSTEYFGDKGGKSLEWKIEEADINTLYVLAFPLETTSENQYISAMVKAIAPSEGVYDEDYEMTLSGIWYCYYYSENFEDLESVDASKIENLYGVGATLGKDTQWSHFYSKTNHAGGTIFMLYNPYVTGSHTLYIDDFSISKEGVEESQFGNYRFMDGTSMATPFVTAAVGIVSNKYNETDSLKVKEKVLQAVRPSTSLTGKVATGGVLDLSKLPYDTVMIPTLNLPTNASLATWNNVNTISVQNTVEGKEYEFSIDGGITWSDCIDNNVVLTNGDRTYEIKVREKGTENTSDTYIYKLDTTSPNINVTPNQITEETQQVTPQITVSDISSGVKNTNIEYAFSTNTIASEITEYQTANLTNGAVTLTSPKNITGTYYLYIKPVEDNATNKSSIDIHKFGPYQLKAPIAVTEVTLNKSEITMHQGEIDNILEATVNPNDATNKNVTWTSSNATIVEVNEETGELTAKQEGRATITVTTEDGGKTATCEVTVVNPSINLPTEEGNSAWIKPADINNINETIELLNTIDGKEYQYSTDEGNTWKLCNYDDTNEKWKINITTEGIHKIKIRLKDSTVISDEYIYKLDASRPQISIEGEKDNPTNIQVTVVDEYSGLVNNYIEYIFLSSESTLTTETIWNKATLDSEGNTNLILPNLGGTYNIYIKPILDNVGIQSIDDGNHIFEGYTFSGIVPVTGVTLNKDKVDLNPGKTEQLIATVLPEDANTTLNWVSSNTSVAIVSPNGIITAIGKGTTTITVTTINGGYAAECEVNVIVPLTGVTLSKTTETINIGETTLLQTVLSPTDASIAKTEWSSNDENIAKVENGLVRAISEGTAEITVSVTDEEGTKLTATCIIIVQKVPPPVVDITGITLNKNTTIIHQGLSEKLIATILPEGATSTLKWTSSNPLVATVSDDGTVIARDKGDTTITVSNEDGTCKDTCKVTVIIPLIDVTLTKTESVQKGKTTNLIAVINPSTASIKQVEWLSSNKNIAKVDNNGVVTGISKGTAQITVKVTDLEGTEKTDICEVTVTESTTSDIVPVTEISLGSGTLQLNKNATQKINLIITPQNADIKSIQWTSSNSKVATVDNDGIVTTVSNGNTDITVTVTDKNGNVKTATCKLTVTEVAEEDDEGEQETTQSDNKEKKETTTQEAKKEDLSTSKEILPATGIKRIIMVMIIVLLVLIISFIRYRNLKDVK